MSENEKNEQLEPVDATPKADSAKPDKADKSDKGSEKKSSKPSIFKRIAKWFKEMKSELKKVQWPGAKTVVKNTGVVIICVLIVGIFIWVFDLLAGSVISALLALVGKG